MATYLIAKLWALLTSKIITSLTLSVLVSVSLLLYILSLLANNKLRKVPGPWWNSISSIPGVVMNLRGTAIQGLDALRRKHGRVVQVGPGAVMVCGKDDLWKVLVEEDFVKDPTYAMLGTEKGFASIFNETDKGAHRFAVSSAFFGNSFLDLQFSRLSESFRMQIQKGEGKKRKRSTELS